MSFCTTKAFHTSNYWIFNGESADLFWSPISAIHTELLSEIWEGVMIEAFAYWHFLELPMFRKVVVCPWFLALQLPSTHKIKGFVLGNPPNTSYLGYNVFTRCYGCLKKKYHLFPPHLNGWNGILIMLIRDGQNSTIVSERFISKSRGPTDVRKTG